MTYTSIIATESIVTNWIKDLERNFQQIDNEEEPGVNADVFHLLLAHREQIDWHDRSGSIANHRGETAEQTEEGRITIYASICFPCRIFRSKSSPPSPGRASNPSVGGIPVPGRACQQKVLREILIRLLARALPQSSSRLFEQFQKIIHLTPAEYRREINGTAK